MPIKRKGWFLRTIREFKEEIYKEFGEIINKISEEAKEVRPEGEWKPDIGVATDMFITKVENSDEYPEAKARVAELKAKING